MAVTVALYLQLALQSWKSMVCDYIGLIADDFFCCTGGRVGTLLSSLAQCTFFLFFCFPFLSTTTLM